MACCRGLYAPPVQCAKKPKKCFDCFIFRRRWSWGERLQCAKNVGRRPHKLKAKRTLLHLLSSSLMFWRCLTGLYLGSGRTPKTFSEKFISVYSRSWLESVGAEVTLYVTTHPDFRSSDDSSGGSRCDCGNGQMLEAQFSQPIWLRIVIVWLFYVPVCRPLEFSL